MIELGLRLKRRKAIPINRKGNIGSVSILEVISS